MEPSQTQTSKSTAFIVFISLCVGVLSGLVNTFFISFEATIDVIFAFGAGFIFGIVTTPWFLSLFQAGATIKKKTIVGLAWFVFSGLSYYLAVLSLMYISGGSSGDMSLLGLSLAGAVGVLVVVSAFHFLFHKIRFPLWVLLVVAGALIPLVTEVFVTSAEGNLPGIKVLYPLWQGVVAMILGYAAVSAPGASAIAELPSDKKRHTMIAVAILAVIVGGLFAIGFYLRSVSYTDENQESYFTEEYIPEENEIADYGTIPEEWAEKSIAEICSQDHRTGNYAKGSVIVIFQPELTSVEIDEFLMRHPEITGTTLRLEDGFNYASLGVPVGEEECFARELSKEPEVKSAEVNGYMKIL